LDRLAKARVDFAFETTLSGRTYLDRIRNWRESGYVVELVFLKISHVDIALKRVAIRVKQGGHFVPESDVRRRFQRGLLNFEYLYKAAVDGWVFYDNTGTTPRIVERSNG
jgi:predicted ABC-type ATPase